MSVKVKCTECGKVLSAPDAARGKAIKCPECQTRIAVPADDSVASAASETSTAKASKSSKVAKPKAKKPKEPQDSEESLLAFDMSRAMDSDARICPKCGFDMKYQDEDETECQKCGFDSSTGGLGAKARKKQMRGPDPADFYPGLVKEAIKFVGRNKMLAIRTVSYTVVCLLLSELFTFMFLWISMVPTRFFIGLCFTVSFLVIPGWLWYLDTEVIKLTLERKDKFKKLNFDFFLASALGLASVAWTFAVAVPVAAIPSLIGYAAVKYGNAPDYVMYIFIGMGLIPAAFVFPVSIAHMSMPVQIRGWQFWDVVRIAVKNFKPLSFCFLWLFITNLLNLTGIGVIAGLYGPTLVEIVQKMEGNAVIARAQFAIQENPNAKLKKKGDAGQGKSEAEIAREKLEETAKTEPAKIDFFPTIVPAIILLVMTAANAFTAMINMRIHGQFTYYNKSSLDLIDRAKEYKYVAKEKVDSDDAILKPKSMQQMITDAVTFVLLFYVLGAIGGMVLGSSTMFGMTKSILLCLVIANQLCAFSVWIMNVAVAFRDSAAWGCISLFLYPIGFIVFCSKNWEERKGPFIQMLAITIPTIVLITVVKIMDPFAGEAGAGSAPPQPPPQGQMAPATDPNHPPGTSNPAQMQMPNPGQSTPQQPGASPP